jgi:hypothetical protein
MQESAAEDYAHQWAAKIVGVCSPDEVQAMVDRYLALADDPDVDPPCRDDARNRANALKESILQKG